MTDPVLILTHPLDVTSDLIVRELGRRKVPVFRADLADFPSRLTLTASLDSDRWSGSLRLAERDLDLSRIVSVYYRRPSMFEFPEGLTETEW